MVAWVFAVRRLDRSWSSPRFRWMSSFPEITQSLLPTVMLHPGCNLIGTLASLPRPVSLLLLLQPQSRLTAFFSSFFKSFFDDGNRHVLDRDPVESPRCRRSGPSKFTAPLPFLLLQRLLICGWVFFRCGRAVRPSFESSPPLSLFLKVSKFLFVFVSPSLTSPPYVSSWKRFGSPFAVVSNEGDPPTPVSGFPFFFGPYP